MTRGRAPYATFEHTADVGLELRGATLPELFERAASALFDTLADVETVAAGPLDEAIELEAPDAELLLAAWLSELLGRAAARGAIYGAFDVAACDGRRLTGRAWGEALDPVRHGFKTEVKAVTYHGLEVRADGAGWLARVILDL